MGFPLYSIVSRRVYDVLPTRLKEMYHVHVPVQIVLRITQTVQIVFRLDLTCFASGIDMSSVRRTASEKKYTPVTTCRVRTAAIRRGTVVGGIVPRTRQMEMEKRAHPDCYCFPGLVQVSVLRWQTIADRLYRSPETYRNRKQRPRAVDVPNHKTRYASVVSTLLSLRRVLFCRATTI